MAELTPVPFRHHYSKLIRLGTPVVLSQMGQAIVQLSDALMVGRLGTESLAAVSFGGALFFVGMTFMQGICYGATPLIGMRYAAGDEKTASRIFQHSILVDMVAALAIAAIMLCFTALMPHMGQDPEVCNLAIPYYCTLVFSIIPLSLFLAFKQFAEGIGNTTTGMTVTLVCNLFNIILNYLFIFGKMGFPEMGVLGAGVATLVSRCCMPLMFMVAFFFLHKRDTLQHKFHDAHIFHFFSNKAFNRRDFLLLFKTGLPIGAQMSVEVLIFSLSAIIAGWFGATGQASHQIATNITTITWMAVTGLASASTICISHYMGVGNTAEARRSGLAAMHITLAYSIGCAVLLLVFRHILPTAFIDSHEVTSLTAVLLIFCAIYQIPDGLQTVTIGALRGLTDVRFPMAACIFSYMCVNLPASYILATKAGLEVKGVWIGFIIGLSLTAFITMRRFFKKTSQNVTNVNI